MRNSAILTAILTVTGIGCGSGEMAENTAERPQSVEAPAAAAPDQAQPARVVEPDRNNDPLAESPVGQLPGSTPATTEFTAEPPPPALPMSASPRSLPNGDRAVQNGSPSLGSAFGDPLQFNLAPNNLSPVPAQRSTQARQVAPPARAPISEPANSAPAPQPVTQAGSAGENETMSGDDEHALTESEGEEYSVVRVFFGTDRKPLSVAESLGSLRSHQFKVPLIAAGVMLLLAFVAGLTGRHKLSVAVVAVGLLVTAGLCAQVIQVQLSQSIGHDVKAQFGAQRGDLQLGVCDVSIPKDHRVGELESSSILRLEFRPDETKHVVLMNVETRASDEFYEELRQYISQSRRQETFVFVHGYNVSFANAARRTAQIAHDLRFDGAPIFYSWPSQASVLGYTVDENNVTWTVPHLKQFLISVAQQSGAESIHLIAHSMGNRALTAALKELTYELQDGAQLFNQVILAAPDIDAAVFKRDIAPVIQQTAQRVTLYASSNDQALIASKQVHGHARAGDSGDGLVVIPGIETVDVSAVDTSFLGHSYYGDSNSIIADLYQVIQNRLSANSRSWLRPMLREGLTYWVFQSPTAEVASPSSGTPLR